jgi:ligand-binding sensor domain-containing protein/signal transduction histidine kinase
MLYAPQAGAFCRGSLAVPGLIAWLLLFSISPASAVILWSDSGSTLARDTGIGADILSGAVKRDDTANDTLYFKFHLNPLSDITTEEYFAAFELYEADAERVGVGNASKAWAYSAFLGRDDVTEASKGSYIDLRSSKPEPAVGGNASSYEFPRRGVERTIVFKVQYIAGGDDLVTVWLDPDLGPGANEVYQVDTLTTRFNADASFDEVRLRHGGGGGGWVFSDMAIATSFSDFVDTSSAKPGVAMPVGMGSAPLSFRSWQREQGMPHNSLRALAQTEDGYLWLGSDDGLSRFDGVHFTSFNTSPGLPAGPVRALLGDSEGALWIGTVSNGLTCYRDGQFTNFKVRDGLPSDSITALTEDQSGLLWIGTQNGLALWKDGRPVALDSNATFRGKSIAALAKDSHGTIWMGIAGTGIFQFQNGKWSQLSDASVNTLLQDPHCLLVDAGGRLWIGAGGDFVLCREGEQWRRYRIPRHSGHSYVAALAEEPDGTIWAGSVSEGLFQFKGGRLTTVNAGSGLADNLVTALFVDREGKLWVGSESALNRLRRQDVFVFSQNEGLGYGPVSGLAEVAPGVVWAAKPHEGLYRWEGRAFNHLNAAGLPAHDDAVGALLVASDRSCWVACEGGLLHFKDPQAIADESRLFALPNLKIISLAEDLKGNIWSGTQEGQLWKLSMGKWIQLGNFSQSKPVTAIFASPDGSVWVGTDGSGLYRFKDENWSHYDKQNGLGSDSIRVLHSKSRNTLWIGTADGGLGRWRDGRIVTFTSREGLPDDTISQIQEDDDGRLWLGGNHGVACISKRELDELADGTIPNVFPHVYGKVEGMLSEECASGFFPAGLKTHSGLVWFSTLKGVVVLNPRHLAPAAPPPMAVLENVLVDGKSVPAFHEWHSGGTSNAVLRIPPGRHQFEFQYTAPSFDAPEQTHFHYQLEGLDTDWSDAGTRRAAFYNYVPPGEYHFRVTAGNSEGVWNPAGASLGLNVARYFWQAWWVIASGAALVLVLVGAGARFAEKNRLQRRMKRLEQERALERERTRIAQDLHDEMGAKLCRISFLSEHARRGGGEPGEIREQIASISDAARDVLHSLDEIVWAVNPQNDTLEHVASYLGQYAQDYFQLTGIECEVDMPAELPACSVSSQERHHLFLAVHEAFTNILKHSAATQAKVSISCSDIAFNITVTDNGKGIASGTGKINGEEPASSGNGLINMRQRMAGIGGDCLIESKPGGGTCVRFIFLMHAKKSNSL